MKVISICAMVWILIAAGCRERNPQDLQARSTNNERMQLGTWLNSWFPTATQIQYHLCFREEIDSLFSTPSSIPDARFRIAVYLMSSLFEQYQLSESGPTELQVEQMVDSFLVRELDLKYINWHNDSTAVLAGLRFPGDYESPSAEFEYCNQISTAMYNVPYQSIEDYHSTWIRRYINLTDPMISAARTERIANAVHSLYDQAVRVDSIASHYRDELISDSELQSYNDVVADYFLDDESDLPQIVDLLLRMYATNESLNSAACSLGITDAKLLMASQSFLNIGRGSWRGALIAGGDFLLVQLFFAEYADYGRNRNIDYVWP